jgi:hypothetical protein
LKLTFRLSEVSTRWGHENRFEIVIQVCQRHLHLHLRKELCILWVKKSWKVSSLLFCCQKKEVEKFATFYANTSSSSPCEKACFTSLVFLSFLFYFFIFSWRFFGRVNISQLWLFAADLICLTFLSKILKEQQKQMELNSFNLKVKLTSEKYYHHFSTWAQFK